MSLRRNFKVVHLLKTRSKKQEGMKSKSKLSDTVNET